MVFHIPNPVVRYGLIALVILFILLLIPISSFLTTILINSSRSTPQSWYKGIRIHHPLKWQPPRDEQRILTGGKLLNVTRVEGAAFVVLARNKDLWELLDSIRGMEDRFNHKYNYPWVFLNNEMFTDEFMQMTTAMTSGKCTYGFIPEEQWPKDTNLPDNVNSTLAMEKIAEMGKKPIPYGGSVEYRKMCRYQSGFFWRHPALDGLKYYWRVEPSVKYYCDLDFDPFRFMVENKKKYAFVVSLYEYPDTIPSLWETTKKFLIKNPNYLSQPNFVDFISPDKGLHYNHCHFWSNFEIADLSLFRSEAYRAYFDYLDEAGGFFYERWGDAPVHSIAAAMFLRPDELHFFDDIGYFHQPFHNCPVGDTARNCACDPNEKLNFEFHDYSCTPAFKRLTHNVFNHKNLDAPASQPTPAPANDRAPVVQPIVVTKTVTID